MIAPDLIALVSVVLAEATRRGDEIVMTLCEELGKRLVAEQNEVALSAIAEDAGFNPDKLPTQIPEMRCPVCDRRKAAKLAAQKRWRRSKNSKKKSHLRVVRNAEADGV